MSRFFFETKWSFKVNLTEMFSSLFLKIVSQITTTCSNDSNLFRS